MLGAIIAREIKLAFRSGGAWLYGVFFFAVFVALSGIALGGSLTVMRPLAPSLIWLATIFSAMLSFPSLFQEDFMDGNLAQYKMSGTSLLSLCAAKAISFAILSLAPLIGAIPSTALIFDMPPQAIIGTILSVIAAAPAIAVYGVFSAAILSGRRGGGFLIVLITAPFLIPLLIFGLGAVDSYASAGLAAVEFRALIGLSLIAIAVGLPAAAAALNANLE